MTLKRNLAVLTVTGTAALASCGDNTPTREFACNTSHGSAVVDFSSFGGALLTLKNAAQEEVFTSQKRNPLTSELGPAISAASQFCDGKLPALKIRSEVEMPVNFFLTEYRCTGLDGRTAMANVGWTGAGLEMKDATGQVVHTGYGTASYLMNRRAAINFCQDKQAPIMLTSIETGHFFPRYECTGFDGRTAVTENDWTHTNVTFSDGSQSPKRTNFFGGQRAAMQFCAAGAKASPAPGG